MLTLRNLEKSYGRRQLFQKVNLQMNAGERLGLVGRNGSGKSTILRLILGEEEPDDGEIQMPRGYRIGHLAQHLKFTEYNILDEACLGLREGQEHERYKAERILFGLGFSKDDMWRHPDEFSGGFQIRLNLAKVLVSEPNLLLLDEPTNYLDIVSIRWITRFLTEWEGEMILISHDRDFMDSVVTHVAAIHRGGLRRMPGDTEKLYAQILQDEEIHEKTRLNQQKKLDKELAYIDRFRAKASKASSVQSRIKRLAKQPALEKLAHLDELDFFFREAPFAADRMMETRAADFHYDPAQPLIAGLNLKISAGERVAVIGKNGRGKSTLLKLLAGEVEPLNGEVYRHPELKIGYFGQTNIQRLQEDLTIEQEVASANVALGLTQVRGLCGTMLFSGDLAEKKISVLSGGEKSRVLLAKILAQPSNFLLLDEPTNHLDMESIEALIESMEEFTGAVVIVTHSERILKELPTKLVVFQHGGVEVFDGGYEEFLDRVGWEEEASSKPKKAPSEALGGKSKKEQRKQRSELQTERARILGPLKKEIEALESQISGWEYEIAAGQEELARASQETSGGRVAAAGKKIKDLEKAIEEAFEKLAAIQQRHDEEEKRLT
ncbi:MAG TPA: ABC-F family ATP-binding cassette domain-containing protein [bacterium]|nr:ABC-F family ATP-binding cassette domain-containing protein [bacterium]